MREDILEGILSSVKKSLGLDPDYPPFDEEIIRDINSTFFILWQLGVGKDLSKPFVIKNYDERWSDFVEDGKIEICKTYVSDRVRLMFDMPSSGTMVDKINERIKENEFRLTVGMDTYNRSDLA